jgi:hypothetical protein
MEILIFWVEERTCRILKGDGLDSYRLGFFHLCYIDDIIVCSSMIEDHGYHLQNVCEHLKVHGLKLCT